MLLRIVRESNMSGPFSNTGDIANQRHSGRSARVGRFCGLGVFLHPRTLFTLLKTTSREWINDNVLRMGAALAYYSIFSLPPLLIIAIAISGLVLGVKAAQGEITAQIQGLIGTDGARAVQTMIQSAHKPAHGIVATILGVLLLFVGATGVFTEMRDALNTIWHVGTQESFGAWSFVRARLLGCGIVLGIGFLLLVSLLLSAFVTAIATYIGSLLPVPQGLLVAGDFLISFLCMTVLFAMIFKILPNTKISWTDVSVGAILTSLFFTVGKFGIGFYIGKSALASAYGATGSLVIVVAWAYYSSLILYFGAEFTRVYASNVGSHTKNA
jgi:membrane protein